MAPQTVKPEVRIPGEGQIDPPFLQCNLRVGSPKAEFQLCSIIINYVGLAEYCPLGGVPA